MSIVIKQALKRGNLIPSVALGVLISEGIPNLVFIWLGMGDHDFRWVSPGLVFVTVLGLVILRGILANRSIMAMIDSPDLVFPGEIVANQRDLIEAKIQAKINRKLESKVFWVPASVLLSLSLGWMIILIHDVVTKGASAWDIWPEMPLPALLFIPMMAQLIVIVASEMTESNALAKLSWATGSVIALALIAV